MAKQTAKAGIPAKVNTIVKRVIAKQEKPVKKYPYYADDEGHEHLTFANMMEEKYDDASVDEGIIYGFTKVINEKNDKVYLRYEVSPAAHTCGFLELGELSVTAADKNLSHLVDLLDSVVGFATGYTLFINTNGTSSTSKTLEKALPLSKHWVKVKTYKNPGSGNMLTLWVTNN